MNPTLMDYILNVLAPSEYKLELKNRLENLCSLSGTPMSPGLSAWLTKTFGLEMTRVVQDYSTFSSPKFSPELQERINRVVPSNYQGYDANLGLKQLFDVNCCDNFRYATVSSVFGASLYNFAGWTIDGVDFYLNYVAVANSKGCSTNDPVTNLGEPFFGQEVIFWYYGTVDPVFTVLDDIGNPIPLNWRTICTKTCYETQIPGPFSLITDIVSGVDFATFTIFPNKTWGANLDVSNPSNVTAAESYYKQLSGASATITSTYDSINDIYIVQIKDTYLAYSPTWGPFPFYEITCP